MLRSESVVNVLKALHAARAEFAPIIKTEVNPHFRSRYADLAGVLESVGPALHAHGLLLTQATTCGTEAGACVETIIHHVESGEYLGSLYPLTPAKPDPQGYGAAQTYARRYSLLGLLALGCEDDDGNAASHAPAPQHRQAPARPMGPGGKPRSEWPTAATPQPTQGQDRPSPYKEFLARAASDLGESDMWRIHGRLCNLAAADEVIQPTDDNRERFKRMARAFEANPTWFENAVAAVEA